MHIVRYRTNDGDPRIGVMQGGRIAATRHADMLRFISDGDAALAQARAAIESESWIVDAQVLAPIPNPGKMLFLGRSFRQFRANLPDTEPVFVYSRVASSIIGPGEAIRMPGPDAHVLYEGELMIVIGREGREIRQGDAMNHVFGYTQVNDVTWTDWIHGSNGGLPQITMSKNADTFCPMGPSIVTRDAFDPSDVAFTVTVNGGLKTKGTTADLVWTLPAIIEFLSRDMTLYPGDVIAIGTSDAQPIVAGDEVVIEFEGLGRLRNPVVAGR